MKKILLSILFIIPIYGASAQFDSKFEDKTLRFDFYHCGDAGSEEYYFSGMKQEPFWAGSKVSLTGGPQYGAQMFRLVDEATGQEIYSRGYSTLFNEWQTTPEAATVRKAMPESLVMPYPKRKARLEIYSRGHDGTFEKKFQYNIDPQSYSIRRFSPLYQTSDVAVSADPHTSLDIVLIPEGYSASERGKFDEACLKFAEALFSYSPYKENTGRINIRGVWAPSAETGVSIPGAGIWKNTAARAVFYTFGMERYQMIEDFQNLRDIAAHAPYDYIYVLSNTDKYGGGGIFNFYGISSANNLQTGKIYIHEFGHVLLGLGDEYTGGVSYSDMYPPHREPWEENLTTLVDFESKMWHGMLAPGTPIPTPMTEPDSKLLGVYEGGGYVSEGVYRPLPQCIMNNLQSAEGFCPVCTAAIQRYIDHICK